MSIFSYLVEEAMEIFIDEFSVYRSSFKHCLKKSRDCTIKVSRQEFSSELGKMSFHGNRRNCLGTQYL